MYIVMKPDELIHYGVRGMRWGVRKENYANRNLRAAAKSRRDAANLKKAGYHEEAKAVSKVAKKQQRRGEQKLANKQAKIEQKRQKAMSVTSSARYTYKQRKHLSDAELRNRINRLNMEKQLKDLSRGRGFSEPQVLSSGRQAANKAIGTYGAKMAVSALGGEFGPAAAAFIKPKK